MRRRRSTIDIGSPASRVGASAAAAATTEDAPAASADAGRSMGVGLEGGGAPSGAATGDAAAASAGVDAFCHAESGMMRGDSGTELPVGAAAEIVGDGWRGAAEAGRGRCGGGGETGVLGAADSWSSPTASGAGNGGAGGKYEADGGPPAPVSATLAVPVMPADSDAYDGTLSKPPPRADVDPFMAAAGGANSMLGLGVTLSLEAGDGA
jgi:hypothetical protein